MSNAFYTLRHKKQQQFDEFKQQRFEEEHDLPQRMASPQRTNRSWHMPAVPHYVLTILKAVSIGTFVLLPILYFIEHSSAEPAMQEFQAPPPEEEFQPHEKNAIAFYGMPQRGITAAAVGALLLLVVIFHGLKWPSSATHVHRH